MMPNEWDDQPTVDGEIVNNPGLKAVTCEGASRPQA